MSDRYYRYRCLVCNAPFDYVNDLDEHVDKQHNPEQVLAAIKADWDNLGACRSCGWHSAWYEVRVLRPAIRAHREALPNEHGSGGSEGPLPSITQKEAGE